MGIFSKKSDNKDTAAQASESTGASEKTTTAKKKAADSTFTATAQTYGVLLAPIVTEKSHLLSSNGQYVFRVATTASSRAIKTAIAHTYGVTVEAVRIIVVKPKRRTMKYDRGYQKKYKKAIVTLAKGQSIDLFHAS